MAEPSIRRDSTLGRHGPMAKPSSREGGGGGLPMAEPSSKGTHAPMSELSIREVDPVAEGGGGGMAHLLNRVTPPH